MTLVLAAWPVQAHDSLCLLAEYATRIPPGQPERVHNLRLAAQALNGYCLLPRAELSFNQVVGPRLEKAGYRPAPVLTPAGWERDWGGGVCQVATTLYNAALLAGLAVRERHPHSLRVDYADPGLDAAVVFGYKDLRVFNPSPHALHLRVELRGEYLRISVWGPWQAKHRVQVKVEVWQTCPPPEECRRDPSLAPGQRLVLQPGEKGVWVRVRRRLEWDRGSCREEIISEDYYPPKPRVILTGAPPLWPP
ncbi:MAG: VanW family protein [Moorellales bacterium]